MPVRDYLEINWGGTIQFNCRWHHFLGWATNWRKKKPREIPLSASINHALSPDYGHNVTSCLQLLPSWLPTTRNCTLNLWARVSPFSCKLLSQNMYFIKTVGKASKYLIRTGLKIRAWVFLLFLNYILRGVYISCNRLAFWAEDSI